MTTPTHQRRSLEDLLDSPDAALAPSAEATPPQDTGETPPPADKPDAAAAAREPAAAADKGAPPAPQKDDAEPTVPRKALEDERRKRQQLEREFHQFRQTQQARPDKREGSGEPDPLVDPAGFRQHLRDEIRREQIEDSRADMIDEVGEDEFTTAEQALLDKVRSDPAYAEQISARVSRSRDPARIVHREGKKLLEEQAKAKAEADPEAQRRKLREEVIADLVAQGVIAAPPAAVQPAPQGSAPPAVAKRPSAPPSLAGVRSAGPRAAEAARPARRPIESMYGDD